MSSPKLLGLPPVPLELRSISSYLQRGDELRQKEPIIAYWCAYYAAQVGISLKAKESSSRTFLLDLLGFLEKLKEEIGPNDAIDIESASAAYVEDFALRVFTMADNEERKGGATRSTAKKFLAAANFLEILKTFPKTEMTEYNEEKIRYAKWKAADIAKAFREGRQPVPGPPGGIEQAFPSVPQDIGSPHTASSVSNGAGGSSSKHSSNSTSPPTSNSPPDSRNRSPPHIKRSTPPPHLGQLPQVQTPPHTPPRSTHLGVNDAGGPGLTSGWGGQGDVTPGGWSTAATPGTGPGAGSGNPFSAVDARFSDVPDSPLTGKDKSKGKEKEKRRRGSGSSSGSGSSGNGKKVHFTPSVTGGMSSTTGSPPMTPSLENELLRTPVLGTHSLPPTSPPDHSNFYHPSGPSDNYNSTQPFVPPPLIYAPPVAPPQSMHPPNHAPHPNSVPNVNYSIYAPPTNNVPSAPPVPPPFVGSSPAAPMPIPIVEPEPAPEELSPAVIAKAQKHCRFAISALDYEDAKRAREELRAALKVLGG